MKELQGIDQLVIAEAKLDLFLLVAEVGQWLAELLGPTAWMVAC